MQPFIMIDVHFSMEAKYKIPSVRSRANFAQKLTMQFQQSELG